MNEPRHDLAHPAFSAGHRSLTRRRFWQLGAAVALTSGATALLPGRTAAAAAQDYFDTAAELAGDDPVLTSLVKALTAGFSVPRPAAPEPLKIFDDVAVLSAGWVSATAILTSGGIILIDALNNPTEAQRYIVSGLRTLGADPAAIKYVVVTHGHGDHFGGAQYLADTYGARVLMAPADWDALASTRPANAPTRDLDITDGQELTLGDTSITLHYTPGHTPGTISPIFPVHWHGTAHTAMVWGGTNPPTSTADKQTYLSSVLSFASKMSQAGVDVELSNHGFCDYGLERMAELRTSPNTTDNPFVLGTSGAQLFMDVMENMLRGRIAQDQESADAAATAAAMAATAPHAGCGC
ncbi:MBL fold metallo-hydrolase [Streptomyces sp. NPDC005811]|uniref:MBL fold metallo-hydrolase n=1 Tax=Streptomyces sp. NPDC005811 TaxID=3154565 RepID=UPI00340B1CEF